MTDRLHNRHRVARIALLIPIVFMVFAITGYAEARLAPAGSESKSNTEETAFLNRVIASTEMPAVRADTTNLKFSEFYRTPVGRFGLEPTERLLSLRGKRVRVVGYMVRQEEQGPGYLILTPIPVAKAEVADGPADDFPPQVVYVHLPEGERSRIVPWTPLLYVFEGTLELGTLEESDGRFSSVRLQAQLPCISRSKKAARKADHAVQSATQLLIRSDAPVAANFDKQNHR